MFTIIVSPIMKFSILLLTFLVFSVIVVRPGNSRTVEEVINSLRGLSPEARQKRLEDGARAERKAVYYGTIQEDDARELLNGFKRKYPFVQTGHLRLSNTRLLGKISTEAKAGRYETDIIQTSGLFGDEDAQKLTAEKLDRVSVRKDVRGKHPGLVKNKYSVVNPSIEGSRIRQYQEFFTEVFRGL